MSRSKRINTIINMIVNCDKLLDVGCDHGYISIGAVETGHAGKAIASDIRKEPLMSAEKNISQAGLTGRISAVLSDGLKDIKEDVDCIVIAGMGGITIMSIFTDALQKAQSGMYSAISNVKQLIISPQSEIPEFRHFINEKTCFYISSETIVYDDSKYYTVMDIRPLSKVSGNIKYYEPFEYEFGIDLRGEYIDYLNHMKYRLSDALKNASNGNSDNARAKSEDLNRRIQLLNQYLNITK